MNDSGPTRDHWQRFRRLMLVTALVALVTIALAIAVLVASGAPIRPPMLVAVALGIGLSLMLGGALMGLAFVSARSGHDDETYTPPGEVD